MASVAERTWSTQCFRHMNDFICNIFPASFPKARSSPVRSQHPDQVMMKSCVGEPSLAPQPEPIATLLPPLLSQTTPRQMPPLPDLGWVAIQRDQNRVKGKPDSKESRLPIRWPLYYTWTPSPTAFCWFIQLGCQPPLPAGTKLFPALWSIHHSAE